jgi:hypothetical protein
MDKTMKKKVGVVKNESSIIKIIDYLHENDRPLAWLHRRTKISYNSLYSIFSQRTTGLSDKKREIINKALKMKF